MKNIYLVSYPRSGNTWMRYLLANIINPDESWHIDNINNIVPDMYQVDITLYEKPTIIKSHEPYTDTYSKVIYMYRDGRDVAISYYNLFKTAYRYLGSFEEFIIAMLKGDELLAYGSWQDHVGNWLQAPRKEDILYIKYEQLCSDTKSVLAQVINFIGANCQKQLIESAVNKSEFNKIKEDVRKYSPHYANGFRGGVKGGPGMWREVFSEEMNDLFWGYAGEVMTMLGYSRS
jgi:estrone sulfotransferase